jgi:hypothetical protein
MNALVVAAVLAVEGPYVTDLGTEALDRYDATVRSRSALALQIDQLKTERPSAAWYVGTWGLFVAGATLLSVGYFWDYRCTTGVFNCHTVDSDSRTVAMTLGLVGMGTGAILAAVLFSLRSLYSDRIAELEKRSRALDEEERQRQEEAEEALPLDVRVRIARLDQGKPSLALPITLFAAGGAAAAIGLWGALFSLGGPKPQTLGILLVGLGVAVVCEGVGVWQWRKRLSDREPFDAEIEVLRRGAPLSPPPLLPVSRLPAAPIWLAWRWAI